MTSWRQVTSHNEFVYVSQSIPKRRTSWQKVCTIWETREVCERSGVFIIYTFPKGINSSNGCEGLKSSQVSCGGLESSAAIWVGRSRQTQSINKNGMSNDIVQIVYLHIRCLFLSCHKYRFNILGSSDIAVSLIETGCDVHKLDVSGNSAFQEAVLNNLPLVCPYWVVNENNFETI